MTMRENIKPLFSVAQSIRLLILIVALGIVLFIVYQNDMDDRANTIREAIVAFNEKRWNDGVRLSAYAPKNNPEINVGLGMCRIIGAGGLAKDEHAAYKLFKSAALQGNIKGHILYGACLYTGTGVSEVGNMDSLYQNKTEAVKWFKKPSDMGDPYAQYVLGVYYLYVEGKDKNPGRGIALLQKSAKNKWADAECVLGLCYYGGIGVESDLKKARMYLTKASEHGNSEAKSHLHSITEKRTEEERHEFSMRMIFWAEFSLCRLNE